MRRFDVLAVADRHADVPNVAAGMHEEHGIARLDLALRDGHASLPLLLRRARDLHAEFPPDETEEPRAVKAAWLRASEEVRSAQIRLRELHGFLRLRVQASRCRALEWHVDCLLCRRLQLRRLRLRELREVWRRWRLHAAPRDRAQGVERTLILLGAKRELLLQRREAHLREPRLRLVRGWRSKGCGRSLGLRRLARVVLPVVRRGARDLRRRILRALEAARDLRDLLLDGQPLDAEALDRAGGELRVPVGVRGLLWARTAWQRAALVQLEEAEAGALIAYGTRT